MKWPESAGSSCSHPFGPAIEVGVESLVRRDRRWNSRDLAEGGRAQDADPVGSAGTLGTLKMGWWNQWEMGDMGDFDPRKIGNWLRWFGRWILFSPTRLGMMIQSDFHIFQGDWKHQLGKNDQKPAEKKVWRGGTTVIQDDATGKRWGFKHKVWGFHQQTLGFNHSSRKQGIYPRNTWLWVIHQQSIYMIYMAGSSWLNLSFLQEDVQAEGHLQRQNKPDSGLGIPSMEGDPIMNQLNQNG